MTNVLLIALLAVLVAVLVWRQNQSSLRIARERAERRARTDQMLARVLLAEDRAERHTIGGGPVTAVWPEPPAPPSTPATPAAPAPAASPAASTPAVRVGASAKPAAARPVVDVDILLEDESETVAERARRQLDRPTTMLSGLRGESTLPRSADSAPMSSLSLLDGRMEVPLDALVLAWFSARGYVMSRAPESAQPISLVMNHRDNRERSYAFYFERGRLHAPRATSLLEKARVLGVHRLLVAAEHGADDTVSAARLRDVLVLDWVVLDREMKKLDFRIAAKLIAIARTRRDLLGLA